MALVQRGGCAFYLRSVRRNGRVTSQYLGSGAVALDLARSTAEARGRTETRLKERRRELVLWGEFDAAFSLLCRLNRAHAHAAMYAAGFYVHHRSWRPRGRAMATSMTPANVKRDEVPDAIRDRVTEFLRLSAHGDVIPKDCITFFESVREELTPASYRWLIKRLAERFNCCDHVSPLDPRARAQQTLIKWLTEGWGHCPRGNSARPGDLEIQRRYLDVLRHDLAGDEPSLVERMLADQIVLGCAEAHGLTCRVADAEKQWQYDEATHIDRRRDRATRRMHESIKLLHLLRTKAGPVLQVNVQNNVALPSREGERDREVELMHPSTQKS